MIINYNLDENDFLTYQLFIASKSERIQKKRQRNRFLVLVFYILFGLYGYYTERTGLLVIFVIIAIAWFFLYPIWERKRYVNHYKGFIKENYKDRLGKVATVEINEAFILTKDETSESRVSTREVKNITDIGSVIFIRWDTSVSLVLPQNKISQFDQLRSYLKDLASQVNIDYIVEEDWRWR